jgi:4-methylaminobutanoate oxidase (formaldehyde-forming)
MNAQIFDVTSAYAVLSLMGPNSRKILQSVTRDDVSDEAFGFGQLKTIGIGGCPINAMRITYVGELGWELHLPVEYATQVYQKIMQAGQQHGIQNAGYRAIESLRLEKGYRAWSADIGPDHTPFESGLGWAVKLKTDIEFKGKAAIKQQVKDGVKKMLACFTIENPDVILLGRETIYRNGHRVGWLSSGGFGYTAGLPIGYGYVRCAEGVDADYIRAGEYEIEVSTQRIKATVHMKPLYDPDMKRVKC